MEIKCVGWLERPSWTTDHRRPRFRMRYVQAWAVDNYFPRLTKAVAKQLAKELQKEKIWIQTLP